MNFKNKNDFIYKMDDMLKRADRRSEHYYACFLPKEKGKQGVFISEYGDLPIVSYAMLYSDEEILEVKRDSTIKVYTERFCLEWGLY